MGSTLYAWVMCVVPVDGVIMQVIFDDRFANNAREQIGFQLISIDRFDLKVMWVISVEITERNITY